MNQFDVIVLGVGAMGSATCYHLARRGTRVLGLEQFDVPNDRGSSHGQTRAIRMAYFEHPDYVPLLRRAYDLWDELAEESGQDLLHRTGMLICGPAKGSEILKGVRRAAREHKIKTENLSASEIQKRWPQFCVAEPDVGIFEPNAGYLKVEEAVKQHARLAVQAGAIIKTHEKILAWSADGNGVVITTVSGKYLAKKLVVTAGAWSKHILSDLGLPLKVHRNVLLWYQASPAHQEGAGLPCYAYEKPFGFCYGFPALDKRGIKVAEHAPGEVLADPENVDRSLKPGDVTKLQQFVAEFFPQIQPSNPATHATCLYTMSPDGHFIIDHHPCHDNVVFAAGFSGHGFKFTTVMGEVLADLALRGKTKYPVDFLGFERLKMV